jgi:hypothetical protein
MNYKIALDVDDVLAAFTPHAHKFHNKEMAEKLDYWCPVTVQGILGEGWFLDHIAPNEEFWRTIPLLSDPKDIDFDVFCYMSSFPEDMFEARTAWLKKNGFPDAPLICTSKKKKTCSLLKITHLVDDKPHTIKELRGSSTKGIHFITPYCGFKPVGKRVINSLKEVKQYL